MKRIVLATALCALPTLATAQAQPDPEDGIEAQILAIIEPVALTDTMGETLNCTALYRALTLVFEDDSEFQEEFQEREGFMASISGALWVNQEGRETDTPEQVFDVLVPAINDAAGRYLHYMEDLSLTTDAPFDDAIMGNIEFCNGLYGSLQGE